jgi:hypothetical protein
MSARTLIEIKVTACNPTLIDLVYRLFAQDGSVVVLDEEVGGEG